MLTTEKMLLIGQVKNLSGVPIKTIRYYESLGLIQSAARTTGGFRQFTADILARLSFIKRAQSLGLSLHEIKQILQVYDAGKLPCDEIEHKLEDKISAIDKQIDNLLTLRSELKGLLWGWENFTHQIDDTICPNIQK